ncbi:MAG: cupin domain-containing protein [Planctomycetes bacterium]|nr:cupin domain-containing protein [Planctomycetota bacterium]
MRVQAILEHEQKDVTLEGAKDARMRMLVGPEDGANVFHMRHFEVAPGGHTPHHQHDYEHEIIVLKGKGVASSEQGDRPFRAGDVLWIPPNEKHQLRNESTEPLEVVCLIPAPHACAD